MTEPDEWLTIAQAAARLGVGERHARRCVALLPAGERSEPGVRPAKVHWTRQNAFLMSGKVSDLNDSTDSVSGQMSDVAADQPRSGGDLPPIGTESVSEASPADVQMFGEMSEVSEPTVGFLKSQIEVKDRQIADMNSRLAEASARLAEVNALVRNEQQLRYHDQQELGRLRAQLAITEAAPEPAPTPPDRRGWLAIWDKIRGRRSD